MNASFTTWCLIADGLIEKSVSELDGRLIEIIQCKEDNMKIYWKKLTASGICGIIAKSNMWLIWDP